MLLSKLNQTEPNQNKSKQTKANLKKSKKQKQKQTNKTKQNSFLIKLIGLVKLITFQSLN